MRIINDLLALISSILMNLAIKIIHLGPMPKHIGFIMDGNRRFAKTNAFKAFKGHEMGFKRLEKVRRILELFPIELGDILKENLHALTDLLDFDS